MVFSRAKPYQGRYIDRNQLCATLIRSLFNDLEYFMRDGAGSLMKNLENRLHRDSSRTDSTSTK